MSYQTIDDLMDQFRLTIGVGCKNLKKSWETVDTDEETKAFMLGEMFVVAITATISNGQEYSDDDYVETCGRIAERMGVRFVALELRRLVVQTRADAYRVRYPHRTDDPMFGQSVFQNSTRYMWKRIDAVKGWSASTAFVFGIEAVDNFIQGVQPGEIAILTGAQGSMKTSLVLGGIENALARHMPVMFFSLDMEPGEIQERRMMRRLGCRQKDLHEMIRNDDSRVAETVRAIDAADEIVFTLEGNDVGHKWNIDNMLEAVKCRMPEILVVDYLTLLRREKQSDLDCVNEAMPKIKDWTQALGLRTILLSQMGRASKSEQQKGSIGGHSKGGGIVEELAHTEIELLKDKDEKGDYNRIIATVTKNRRGPSGRSYELEVHHESATFTGYATRVQRAGRSANTPVFETLSAPESWTRGSKYMEHSTQTEA